MSQNCRIDKQKVQKIFSNMNYETDKKPEEYALLKDWLDGKHMILFRNRAEGGISDDTNLSKGKLDKFYFCTDTDTDADNCHVFVPHLSTIENFLSSCNTPSDNRWHHFSPLQRQNILYRFGTELSKHKKLFSEIEFCARAIPKKQTADNLKLLTDYLQFYSLLANGQELSDWKPPGISVGIISLKTPLFLLGCLLGPCLALGYNIILQSGHAISLVIALLVNCARDAGIPESTIRVIPEGSDANNLFYMSSKVSVITIFDEMSGTKYDFPNTWFKKILNVSPPVVPMIIFDSADLESSLHCLKEAVINSSQRWEHGALPIRNVYVQENVFGTFVERLKKEMDLIRKEWKPYLFSEGMGLFATKSDFLQNFLIGADMSKLLAKDWYGDRITTVTAFRGIGEALALANNTNQGVACSVWTENLSLAMECSRTLEFTNIWINSFGLFTPEQALSPYKDGGNGHFGGHEGFYEYFDVPKVTADYRFISVKAEPLDKVINSAKKAQIDWSKLTRFDRLKILQELAHKIDENRTTFTGLSESWIDEWITSIGQYVSEKHGENSLKTKEFTLLTSREPIGVLAVELERNFEAHNKKLIIASLIEGNALILLEGIFKFDLSFYVFLQKNMPSGILNVRPLTDHSIVELTWHNEIKRIFRGPMGTGGASNLRNSLKFKMAADNWRDVRNQSTLLKTVWLSAGQSFT